MTQYTLTLVDVRRVQSYLFNANELKQNLGASALVEQATHDWIEQALEGRHNIKTDYTLDDTHAIERGELDAEVIFLGGGNAAILFPDGGDDPPSRRFARAFTRSLLERAPGLEAAVAYVPDIDLSQPKALLNAWQKMQQKAMPTQKEGHLIAQPLLGLAVTAECAYTGLPAVAEEMEDGRGTLLSAQAYAKQSGPTVVAAKERLNRLLPIDGFEYPSDFDDLGSKHGHASTLAVIHADGNSMGKRIQRYTEHEDNREMIRCMRKFSESVNVVGLNAMQSVSQWLARVIHDQEQTIVDCHDKSMTIKLTNHYLPLRPLVFGGDDVTIVCDGRLGLALAAKLLESFSAQTLPDEEKAYACAGVAIVHTHYPFARAYALAEELCKDAKKQARAWDGDSRVSVINWHLASSGLTLDWGEIKRREYQDGNLLLRPLAMNWAEAVGNVEQWRTWQAFTEQIEAFRDKTWSTRRNKLKDLRMALRKSPDVTRQFTQLHEKLPPIPTLQDEDVRQSGWLGARCLYFDALEADDLFIYPNEA